MMVKTIKAENLKHGDTMLLKDKTMITVDRKYIKNTFMGLTIYGQPYRDGDTVDVVRFPVWFQGVLIRYE